MILKVANLFSFAHQLISKAGLSLRQTLTTVNRDAAYTSHQNFNIT